MRTFYLYYCRYCPLAFYFHLFYLRCVSLVVGRCNQLCSGCHAIAVNAEAVEQVCPALGYACLYAACVYSYVASVVDGNCGAFLLLLAFGYNGFCVRINHSCYSSPFNRSVGPSGVYPYIGWRAVIQSQSCYVFQLSLGKGHTETHWGRAVWFLAHPVKRNACCGVIK